MTLEIEPGIFRIEISRLAKTGMLLGICQSMKGLYVHGRKLGELEDRIPTAIEGILKAQGCTEVEIERLSKGDPEEISRDLIILKYRVDFRSVEAIH